MKKVGKNDPCPCGSGKKYKKCCLLNEQLPTVTRLLLLKTCDDLMPKLLKYALMLNDKDGSIDKAWKDFRGHEYESNFHDSPYVEMFFRWMLFFWISEDYLLVDKDSVYPSPHTIGARFLRKNRKNLDSVSIRYLESAFIDPLSFWQMEAVSPGRGIMARDLITGRERFIEDVSCSESMHTWDIILGNTIEIDGTCVFNTIAPFPLPPITAESIMDEFGRMADLSENDALLELFKADYYLIWHYQKCVDEFMNRPPQVLQNTDGNDLIMMKTTYEFDSSNRDDILNRLTAVEEFENEPESRKGSVSYTWKAPSQRQIVTETVVKGTITVRQKYLETECNSSERNELLERMLKDALGDLIRYRKATTEHPDEMIMNAKRNLKKGRTDEPQTPDPKDLPEEVLAELNEHMEKLFMSWADTPVPALNNMTPREAVTTDKGRGKVTLLINDWENTHSRMKDQSFTFDFNKLRADLNLPLE
jgi:uncharacterized protein YecA (UPF0149 family)